MINILPLICLSVLAISVWALKSVTTEKGWFSDKLSNSSCSSTSESIVIVTLIFVTVISLLCSLLCFMAYDNDSSSKYYKYYITTDLHDNYLYATENCFYNGLTKNKTLIALPFKLKVPVFDSKTSNVVVTTVSVDIDIDSKKMISYFKKINNKKTDYKSLFANRYLSVITRAVNQTITSQAVESQKDPFSKKALELELLKRIYTDLKNHGIVINNIKIVKIEEVK